LMVDHDLLLAEREVTILSHEGRQTHRTNRWGAV
jgi:hypothetical protein